MKPMDKSFCTLYTEHDTAMDPESGDVNPMTTYQNVLRKAGLAPRQQARKRYFKILLAAAILATAALTAAATVYRASDAFRGALEIHNSAKGSSAADPVVDRTGQVVNQTKKGGAADLSLRAAVSDGRTLKLLVDVTDRSGKGPAIGPGKGGGEFGLRAYDLTKENGDFLPGGSSYSFTNIDPAKGKFTILFDYAIAGESIRNETLKLHLEDILQAANLEGTALDMEPDGLYQAVSQFGPYSDADFRLSSTTDRDCYLLHVTDSKRSLPLSKDFPGIQIVAAAVRDGSLYLQGTADTASALDKVLELPALGKNGTLIQASEISRGDGNSWAVRFDGVGSLDFLKGATWRYGAGEGFHTAYEGVWDFTFQVKSEDLAVKRAPNVRTTWEGHDLTITALEISPYSLFLQYATDEATALRMFPPTEWGTLQTSDWINSYHPITLTMQDGATLQVDGGSLAPKGGNLAMTPADAVITEYEMQYGINTVIDPGQVRSVQIGSQVISLQQ